MKDVAEWDLDYILNIPPGEHNWVEFKRSQLLDLTLKNVNVDDVLNELGKQLSAFANSGGGSIVYGIADSQNGRSVDANGGVSTKVRNGTKEWLEDVIPNLVEYSLTDFNVYPIELPAPADPADQRALFIVHVESSATAPHQSSRDQKYYARVGGKSRPIPHRLIMDILGRSTHPLLTLEIAWTDKLPNYGVRDECGLVIRCRNIGKIFANYVSGWVWIPKAIEAGYGEGEEERDAESGVTYKRIFFKNTKEDTVGYTKGLYGEQALTISRFDPVLPRLSFHVSRYRTGNLAELENFSEMELRWIIHADNAPEMEGRTIVGDLISDWRSKNPTEDLPNHD